MSKPIQDPKYRAFIRSLPCSVRNCGSSTSECAHVGPHGLNQKASDYSTVPLCPRHHRTGNDSLHKLGPRKFEQKFGLDLIGIAERLAQFPMIRIELSGFVAYLEGESYCCGPVSIGPAKARELAIQYFKIWRREQLIDLRRRDFGGELRFPRREELGVTERIGS